MKFNFIQKYSLCLLIVLPSTIAKIKQAQTCPEKVKTAIYPIEDSHPLRYNYYKISNSDKEKRNNQNCFRWSFDGKISYMYERSFDNCRTATTLFQYNPVIFNDDIDNQNDYSLLLENFVFKSEGKNPVISFNPQIQNHIYDLSGKVNLYTESSSFFLTLGIPFVRTDWKMKTESKNIKLPSSQKVEAGLFINKEIATDKNSVNVTAKEYLEEVTQKSEIILPFSSPKATYAPNFFKALAGYKTGDIKQKSYGKINTCGAYDCTSEWNFSNIVLQLGWNAIEREHSHLGIYLKSGIPLGTEENKRASEFIFSKKVGNGRRWELGLGINAHTNLTETDSSRLEMRMDGYISHIFSKKRFAFFDLKNKPLTRYSLVKAFKPSVDNLEGQQPYSYADAISTVADITGQCINVSIPVRAETIIAINYERNSWNAEIGYSFLGEQAEKTSSSPILNKKFKYGLKGLSLVENLTANASGAVNVNAAGNLTDQYISPSATAYEDPNNTEIKDIKLSVNGVLLAKDLSLFLTDESINTCSALMDAKILHKLFANFEYSWKDTCYSPKLGIFGSIGLSPVSSYTPKMWDIGIYVGANY